MKRNKGIHDCTMKALKLALIGTKTSTLIIKIAIIDKDAEIETSLKIEGSFVMYVSVKHKNKFNQSQEEKLEKEYSDLGFRIAEYSKNYMLLYVNEEFI